MNRLSTFLWVLLLTGCLQSAGKEVKPYVPPVDTLPNDTVNTITVTTDGDVVSNLHKWLGDRNTVELVEPLRIVQPDATISFPGNSSLGWELTPSGGTFTFLKNKPEVTVRRWGVPFSPSLDRVVIVSPDKGTAYLNELGNTITKEFRLNWVDDSAGAPVESASPPESPIFSPPTPLEPEPEPSIVQPREGVKNDPQTLGEGPVEVYFFGDLKTCAPCRRGWKELSEYDKKNGLPFKVVLNPKDMNKPANVGTPYFRWGSSGANKPDGTDRDWCTEGWYGVDDLIKRWHHTKDKEPPKPTKGKIARSTGRCSIGFAGEYVETKLGYTTVDHLINVHGLHYEDIRPYAHNQTMLNKIHGWCHYREMGLL